MMKNTRCKTASKKTQQTEKRHQVKVFCRVRSLRGSADPSCIKVVSSKTVMLIPSDNAISSHNGSYKEIHCSFDHVFEENAKQDIIFEHVALPLINDLFRGKNCLLLAYGISGSGKTYTMTGEPKDSGLIPRTLDVIFNSISHLQAEKFVFKSDKMNGFEVQNEKDAWKERQRELEAYMKSARTQKMTKRENSEEFDEKNTQYTQLESVDEDNTFAIFISYVEIYNNGVYDLLEDNLDVGKTRHLQPKIVREDSVHNMYVHGVVEMEVKSSKEAYEVLYKGIRKKRIAFTSLNSDSSRSHSIFSIRLVQTPLDRLGEAPLPEKRALCVSQLCLVDLAGSERTSRTKNSGQRLMESGNINNSLMTLKACLETLRENQMLRTKKLVPYRDSKLTYLFKNYFEGKSNVHMLICVNPRAAEFDETVQVMKFADVTKEVQVFHQPSPLKHDPRLPVGRRYINQVFQEELQKLSQQKTETEQDSGDICSLNAMFPCLKLKEPMADKFINNLADFLIQRSNQYNLRKEQLESEVKTFRQQLEMVMQKNILTIQEHTHLQYSLEYEQKKRVALESKVKQMDALAVQLELELDKKNQSIEMMKQQLSEKEMHLKQQILDRERLGQKYHSKLVAEIGKGACQMHYQLRKQETMLKKVIEEKTRPLSKLKHVLTNETDHSSATSSGSNISQTEQMCAHFPTESLKTEHLDHQQVSQAHTSLQQAAYVIATILSPISSKNKQKADSVTAASSEAQLTFSNIEKCKQDSYLAASLRKKKSIKSPTVSAEETNTNAVA